MVGKWVRSVIATIVLAYCGFLGALIALIPGLSHLIDIGTAYIASWLRLWTGSEVAGGIEKAPRPKQILALFEYEANPQCKKVREVLSVLDLDCLVYPCPRPTIIHRDLVPQSRFRDRVVKDIGSYQLPYLYDEGAGKRVIGGDQIVDYLWENYSHPGAAKPFLYSPYVPHIVNEILLWTSICLRPALRKTGAMQTPSRFPSDGKPLKFWSFESCPSCRLVRETLSTLELPYILYNSAKGSQKLQDLKSRVETNLPYLEDPNNNFAGSDSSVIIGYLKKTYQIASTKGGTEKAPSSIGGIRGSESKSST
jgi:glutaredoxin